MGWRLPRKRRARAVVAIFRAFSPHAMTSPTVSTSCPRARWPWDCLETQPALDLVRHICNELSRYADFPRFSTGGPGFDCWFWDDLFSAYRGLALLGKKHEALDELDRLYKALLARLEAEYD